MLCHIIITNVCATVGHRIIRILWLIANVVNSVHLVPRIIQITQMKTSGVTAKVVVIAPEITSAYQVIVFAL